MIPTEPVLGVLLAGGQSRRMGGGDKCLREMTGRTILERVVERARPQVSTLILNANGDPARFGAYSLPVVSDVVEGFAGPLAGVLSALEWARENTPGLSWAASFATDAPFFPADLVVRLAAAVKRDGADMACARCDGRAHPVFALWPVRLADDLRRALVEEEIRKVDMWTGRYRLAVADFSLEAAVASHGLTDPFFNVNRPQDLQQAEKWLVHGGGKES